MNKYSVLMPCPEGTEYRDGQLQHMQEFRRAGIPYDNYKWTMGQGYKHQWTLTCSEEQLTVLALAAGATVVENLTQRHRQTGLAKLTFDEKQALGLV